MTGTRSGWRPVAQLSANLNAPETLAVRADRDAAFATAKAVLTGAVADPTNGALFFHASRIRPGWFESRTRVGEIGNHVFYR